MKIRFLAGEMAQLHHISKQTLIYYDKIGLIRPREVDPETGYRYYHLDQSEDLDMILFLKSLGMSLKEIKGYRNQRSSRARISLLESQSRVLCKKLDQIQKTQQQLASMVKALKFNLGIRPSEKGIKWINDRPLLSRTIPPPHDLYALELCFKEIFRSGREEFDADIHDFMVYVEEDGSGDLFKKVALPVAGRANDIIKAGYFAYGFHKGPYDALPHARQELKTFIRKSGHGVAGPYVERLLVSNLAVSHEKDYLVEIQVPVERSAGPARIRT